MKNLTCGIYCITNKVNGKKYVGSSARAEYRMAQHKSECHRRRKSTALYMEMRIFGLDAFEFEILEECEKDQLKILEEEWILKLNTVKPYGYNIGGTVSVFPSPELLAAMPPEQQAWWRKTMQGLSTLGHAALRDLRKDAEFERQYRAMRRAASFKREALIREKRKSSQEADDYYRLIRKNAAKEKYDSDMADPERSVMRNAARQKSKETFRERMKDPEYASMISEQRKRANAISLAKRWGKTINGCGVNGLV